MFPLYFCYWVKCIAILDINFKIHTSLANRKPMKKYFDSGRALNLDCALFDS